MSTPSIVTEGTSCFPVERVELWGDLVERFQWALDTASAVPGCLDAAAINGLLGRTQNAIVARGYVTTRVLAEPQDLRTGVLRLTVVPGRIRDVRFVEPERGRKGSDWQLNALAARPGDLLNLRDIEQALENLRRLPSAEADIEIVPAEGGTARPGDSDLLIRFAQRFPVRLDLGADDAGTDSTGTYQSNATVSFDNLARLNDLAYVSFNTDVGGGDPGPRGTRGFTAHYSVPYGNWELGFTHSENRNRQSVAGIDQSFLYRGRSETDELALSRVLYRDGQRKTTFTARGFEQSSKNFIDDTEILVQRRRVRGFELEATHREYLASSALEVSVGYRRGKEQENLFGLPLDGVGREVKNPSLVSYTAQWSVPFSLREQRFGFSAVLRGQEALTPMVSQDGFAIGGRSTVRGFDGENILSAERGFTLRNELSAALGNTGQSLYLGADYGEVAGPSSPTLAGQRLAGAVIGVRGGYGAVSYDGFVGQPIERPNAFPTDKRVVGFNFRWSF
jgi:hemolysin activation/secretion protein